MKDARGFTLVELLVAMVAAMILLGALVRLILASYQTWFGVGSGSHYYQKAITSFEDLGGDIRSASVVLANSNQEQLVLQTRSGSSRWWFADHKFWCQKAGEPAKVLLTELEEGSFSYWQEKTGEQNTPPGGSYSILISASWDGGSLKTGYFVREWS